MSDLRVSPEQLNTLGGVVARISAEVRSEHQGLRSQLAPLFGAEWSGAAASRFTALYEELDQHARGLCDALDGIGRLLAQAGTTYAEIEQRIAASFR